MTQETALQKRLRVLLEQIGNRKCADCSALHPQFVSLVVKPLIKGGNPFGVFCCEGCSKSHMKLGVEVCRVKSMKGVFGLREVWILEQSGNQFVNVCLQAKLKVSDRSDGDQEDFIRRKYHERLYFSEDALYQKVAIKAKANKYATMISQPKQTTTQSRTDRLLNRGQSTRNVIAPSTPNPENAEVEASKAALYALIGKAQPETTVQALANAPPQPPSSEQDDVEASKAALFALMGKAHGAKFQPPMPVGGMPKSSSSPSLGLDDPQQPANLLPARAASSRNLSDDLAQDKEQVAANRNALFALLGRVPPGAKLTQQKIAAVPGGATDKQVSAVPVQRQTLTRTRSGNLMAPPPAQRQAPARTRSGNLRAAPGTASAPGNPAIHPLFPSNPLNRQPSNQAMMGRGMPLNRQISNKSMGSRPGGRLNRLPSNRSMTGRGYGPGRGAGRGPGRGLGGGRGAPLRQASARGVAGRGRGTPLRQASARGVAGSPATRKGNPTNHHQAGRMQGRGQMIALPKKKVVARSGAVLTRAGSSPQLMVQSFEPTPRSAPPRDLDMLLTATVDSDSDSSDDSDLTDSDSDDDSDSDGSSSDEDSDGEEEGDDRTDTHTGTMGNALAKSSLGIMEPTRQSSFKSLASLKSQLSRGSKKSLQSNQESLRSRRSLRSHGSLRNPMNGASAKSHLSRGSSNRSLKSSLNNSSGNSHPSSRGQSERQLPNPASSDTPSSNDKPRSKSAMPDTVSSTDSDDSNSEKESQPSQLEMQSASSSSSTRELSSSERDPKQQRHRIDLDNSRRRRDDHGDSRSEAKPAKVTSFDTSESESLPPIQIVVGDEKRTRRSARDSFGEYRDGPSFRKQGSRDDWQDGDRSKRRDRERDNESRRHRSRDERRSHHRKKDSERKSSSRSLISSSSKGDHHDRKYDERKSSSTKLVSSSSEEDHYDTNNWQQAAAAAVVQLAKEERLKEAWEHPDNQLCSECTNTKPTWGSFFVSPVDGRKLGVFCCFACYGLHKQVGEGEFVLKNVREVDQWADDDVDALELSGNRVVNLIYEANVTTEKEDRDKHEHGREAFFFEKYMNLSYFSEKAHKTVMSEALEFHLIMMKARNKALQDNLPESNQWNDEKDEDVDRSEWSSSSRRQAHTDRSNRSHGSHGSLRRQGSRAEHEKSHNGSHGRSSHRYARGHSADREDENKLEAFVNRMKRNSSMENETSDNGNRGKDRSDRSHVSHRSHRRRNSRGEHAESCGQHHAKSSPGYERSNSSDSENENKLESFVNRMKSRRPSDSSVCSKDNKYRHHSDRSIYSLSAPRSERHDRRRDDKSPRRSSSSRRIDDQDRRSTARSSSRKDLGDYDDRRSATRSSSRKDLGGGSSRGLRDYDDRRSTTRSSSRKDLGSGSTRGFDDYDDRRSHTRSSSRKDLGSGSHRGLDDDRRSTTRSASSRGLGAGDGHSVTSRRSTRSFKGESYSSSPKRNSSSHRGGTSSRSREDDNRSSRRSTSRRDLKGDEREDNNRSPRRSGSRRDLKRDTSFRSSRDDRWKS